ncbi:hypothetical protein KY345_05645 [Candidatus Woesearchaeota archaeon]|nr:hypothetical protein [Candidatus Woesearchaeota archaeon]
MHWFLQGMLDALWEIVRSPFKEWSVWWFLAPVLILWVILELYFGRYKSEQLGWNTSLANGISLVWINIESMRFLFSNHPEPFLLRFIPVSLILIYGGFVIYVSFAHKFSGKVTYALAAPTPIYFLSAISVLWGHGELTLTWFVILDLILLYPIIVGIFALLRKFLPEVPEEKKGKFDIGGLGETGGGLGGLESEAGKSPGLGELKL